MNRFFKLGGESSVYERMLLQEKDEETKIKEAKARIQIARMIRETKAVDYNQAIRLEKNGLNKLKMLIKH